MNQAIRSATNGEEFLIRANQGDWRVAWHPPSSPPEGIPHGANGICLPTDDTLVLISNDSERWGLPGGRPEANESWSETLSREMFEEAEATVVEARLLGFTRAVCLSGSESGLILVRSLWRTLVELAPWEPRFEIPYRRVVPAEQWREHLWIDEGWGPIMNRAFAEAGLG